MTRGNKCGDTGDRIVGDYIIGHLIGSGSFSNVWAAQHRVHGTEVAVKEMSMDNLNKKLQSSLLYEIQVLRRISHPNIIALHEIIQDSGRIYLILEYCKGGDLYTYIQHHGKVPEVTAKHFMQQLATGLHVLREHNLIHRDLKPQNLLLSTNDENSVLKIADFGFARSLQPRGLAETFCGSPLYMAPEIMQLRKYDAKADLWSVGAILFQLVTGNTPFTGGSPIQLLQNIIKSNELRFPPDNNLTRECIDLCHKLLRRNPVERLTFEEFFKHPFLAQHTSVVSASQISSMQMEGSSPIHYSSPRNAGENFQEECLPFPLDDESKSLRGSALTSVTKGSYRSTYGFCIDEQKDKIPSCGSPKIIDVVSVDNSARKTSDLHWGMDGNLKVVKRREPSNLSPKGPTIVDSLEFVDQDYVIVPGPPLETSSLSVSASCTSVLLGKSDISVGTPPKLHAVSAPMPICGIMTHITHAPSSLESHDSPASGISQGYTNKGDLSEQQSPHCMTRIRLLQNCASVITELVKLKVEEGKRLEAFSLQLVILAIWKQALRQCHAQPASTERSSSPADTSLGDPFEKDAACSEIERGFLVEVARTEELAHDLGRVDETMEMPDGIELIFQYALTLGRDGAVEEVMDDTRKASSLYAKAVALLYFLLVEAPSIILNPPVILTTENRKFLRTVIDVLSYRQNQPVPPRMSHLKSKDT